MNDDMAVSGQQGALSTTIAAQTDAAGASVEWTERTGFWDIITVFILIFFASNPNVFLVTSGADAASSDSGTDSAGAGGVFYAIALMCYVLSGIGALFRLRGNIVPVLRAWPVWAMVTFAFLSSAWSVMPIYTLQRAIAFLGTTLPCLLLATFPKQRQLNIVTIVGGIVLLLSLFLAAAVPSIAIMKYEDGLAVRGLYVHKNMLGWCGCMFCVFALGAYQAKSMPRVISGGVIILALVAMVLSKSSSGLVGAVLAFLLFGLISTLRISGQMRPLLIAVLALGLVALAIIVPFVVVQALESMGKTLTLSGRLPMWAALMPAIRDKLALGWGFGGAIWASPIGTMILNGRGVFYAGNAQGGHIENLVDIGAVGCLIFYVPYFIAMFRMYSKSNRGDVFAETVLANYWVMLFLGVTAPILLGVNQLPWILIALPYLEQAGLHSLRARMMNAPKSNRILRI